MTFKGVYPRAMLKYEVNSSHSMLPVIRNQKFNSYLKEIASLVGIEKKLIIYTVRKTFASTVLLYNDVPMEIVSELLARISISTTTESYGKIIRKKISDEVLRLRAV